MLKPGDEIAIATPIFTPYMQIPSVKDYGLVSIDGSSSAEDFQTVYAVLPHNTILVYSFSKLYGVTGWRVGLIAMNEDNVCDRLLSELANAA